MGSSFFVQWLLGFTAATNLILGLFIFKRVPRTLFNRLFLGFALNTSLWNFAVLMVTFYDDYGGLLFWIKFSYAVAATTPWFIYALVHTFEENRKYPFPSVFLMLLLSLLISGLCFTSAIIKDLVWPLEVKHQVYGPLFPLYPAFFGAVILFAFLKLSRQLKNLRGLVRYQIRYFMGGIFLAFVFGSLFNLFLPYLGVRFVPLRSIGPVSTLLAVSLITYAIARYRLMDIHMALRKILAYAFSVMFLAIIYIIPLFFLENNLGLVVDVSLFIYYAVFLVVTVAAFFQPVKDYVQTLVDRYFYRGAYDYFTTLQKVNEAMISLLNRDELLAFLLERVVKTIYIQGAVFYLKGPDSRFTVIAEKHSGDNPTAGKCAPLLPKNPLPSYLKKTGKILLKTDLRGVKEEKKRDLVEEELEKIGAEVAVPLLAKEKLLGIFSLGPKLSGEPYSLEDVNLLSTLASQLTIALKNAQLYQEVLLIKQYLENILGNMGNGLIAVSVAGKVTVFNSAAERLTGLKAAEMLGREARGNLPDVFYVLFLETLEVGRGKSGVELMVEKGDEDCFLSCSAVLVEAPETGEHEVILVFSDVTRIKKLEQEKNRALRLASLGEVAAGMAHEIKNPLVSIKTFAELLPTKYDDGEFRSVFSRIVGQEIERINRLLTELLDFTRECSLHYEEVRIDFLLDETLALLSHQLEDQKIKIFKFYGADLPPAKVDKDQIKQALFNICLNGVQAMPQGGRLSVCVATVKKQDGDRIKGPVLASGLKIEIKDTGEGIPPGQGEKIFHPFYTTKSRGIGIGLSISHKIITAHGGNIQFNSNGGGTVFEIYLPLGGKESSRPWPGEKGDFV